MSIHEVYDRAGIVSDDQVTHYHEQGFLTAPGLLTVDEIAELQEETTAIFRGRRGHVEGLVDVEGLTDAQVLQRYVAIHFPHKLSPLIKQYLSHPRVLGILQAIIGPNIKCMQSMLFVKAPGKAGQSWHQDEYFIPTRDRSLVGVWIAIDDATIENGCLWMLRGSHRPGILYRRVPNDDTEFAETDTIDVALHESQRRVPVEVKSGTVVFFNGYTLHSSRRNNKAGSFRMALVNHYMSAESLLPWDQDHKLPPTEDLRDIVMVAGMDPYAWKGTTDANKPYLRSEKPRPRGEL